MLKMESVCTFCWWPWCWSLDQDQTCCVLARLSCTGHPVKACDARTSPRPCGHEYNSTYALSFVVGVVPVLHAAFSELYHFWLAPRCVQRHKKHLGIFEKNVFGRWAAQIGFVDVRAPARRRAAGGRLTLNAEHPARSAAGGLRSTVTCI